MPLPAFERFRRWRLRGAPRAAILRYHRVVDLALDPYDIAVRPDRFAEHLAVLSNRAPVISLERLVDGLIDGQLPDGAIAITFDDGYRDVLTVAHRLLTAAGMPATVFVVTDHLATGREFWWDTLARVFLWTESLPERLDAAIAGDRIDPFLGDAARQRAADFERHRWWTWHSPTDPTERHRLLRQLHARFKALDPASRGQAVTRLLDWAKIAPATPPEWRTATRSDVEALRLDRWLGFGAHTVSHPDLGTLARADQRAELATSRQALGEVLGREVTTFAYPFGRTAGRSMLTESGYRAACTARDGLVRPSSDRLRLPRLGIGNWSGPEFARCLEAAGL